MRVFCTALLQAVLCWIKSWKLATSVSFVFTTNKTVFNFGNMEWKKKQLKTLFKGGILVKGIWFLSIPLLVLLLGLLLGILLCPVDFLIPICSTLLCLRNVFLTIYLTGSILSKSLFGFDYLCYYRTSATLAFSEEQGDLICCAMLPP